MITVITPDKHTALTVARALEADNEANRHYYNDKYYITWMVGKMIEITTPRGQASYWFRNGSFPHLPKYMTLSVTTRTLRDGTPLNPDAAAQTATIKMLLAKSDSVINAMEPNPEGELKFRYLCAYLGTKLPCRRAVLNELTYGSVKFAVTHPQPCEKFDNWYNTARLRDEANWLVNINTRRAMAFAAGRGTYQVGRTATPVLCMVAERGKAVRNATPQENEAYTTIALKDRNGNIFPLKAQTPGTVFPEEMTEATILTCESKEVKVKTPKLHNLLSLQCEAAKEFDMDPRQSYEAAMALYERRLISFPATTATTVSRRRYEECRKSLQRLLCYKAFASAAATEPVIAQGRAVDTHPYGLQGIVTTSVPPLMLAGDMSKIYFLVARRMFQAFSRHAVAVDSTVVAECNGILFSWSGRHMKVKGWTALFPKESDRFHEVPAFNAGETVEIFARGSVSVTPAAPKPYTTASLMDELLEIRGISHGNEIAKDIVHLEESGWIERDVYGNITLKEKGRALYSIVRDMAIADEGNIARFDAMMRQRLHGETSASAYQEAIKAWASDLTAEILASAKLYPVREESMRCPCCGQGQLQLYGFIAKCGNPDCGKHFFRRLCGVDLSREHLMQIADAGTTSEIKGFRSFKGNSFKAKVVLTPTGSLQVTTNPKFNPSNSAEV